MAVDPNGAPDDDIEADLIGAMQHLERNRLAGPGAAPHPRLDDGQVLMLVEAWRRIDQVFTELNRDACAGLADFVAGDDADDLDPEARRSA